MDGFFFLNVFFLQTWTEERFLPPALEPVLWNHGRCWGGKWKWQRYILDCCICFSGENMNYWNFGVAITQSIHVQLGHFRFSYFFIPVCYLTILSSIYLLCYSCTALVCVSLTTLNIFRLYCSGSHGPVLLLLHGGGHSALSWAVFTVSIIVITETL